MSKINFPSTNYSCPFGCKSGRIQGVGANRKASLSYADWSISPSVRNPTNPEPCSDPKHLKTLSSESPSWNPCRDSSATQSGTANRGVFASPNTGFLSPKYVFVSEHANEQGRDVFLFFRSTCNFDSVSDDDKNWWWCLDAATDPTAISGLRRAFNFPSVTSAGRSPCPTRYLATETSLDLTAQAKSTTNATTIQASSNQRWTMMPKR